MLQDTLKAAADTVEVVRSSSSALNNVITALIALVAALAGYFGGKHGAQKGTGL